MPTLNRILPKPYSACLYQYPSLNNGYKVPFKSVASFRTDPVGFTSASGSNVIFKDEMGIPVIKSGSELTIRGMAGGSETALYAWQPTSDTTEEIVGKLNIVSLDEQFKQVIIVPVNGAEMPDPNELQATLNEIYAQAITSWTVSSPGGLDGVVFENENFTHGGSSAIATYNADQKAVINAFEENYGQLEPDVCYLFYIKDAQFKERSIAGYMPLQRQAGFIYGNPKLNVVAHELGHGAFNLWHSFSTENSATYIAAERKTNNLMDYTTGANELWQHQWGQVQNPDNIMLAFLQDEEEGEFTTTGEVITIYSPWYTNKISVLLNEIAIETDPWQNIILLKEVMRLARKAIKDPAKDAYAIELYGNPYAAERKWDGDENYSEIILKVDGQEISFKFLTQLLWKEYDPYTIRDAMKEFENKAVLYTAGAYVGTIVGYLDLMTGGNGFRALCYRAVIKTTISAGIQALTKKEIDFVDALSDGVLPPGYSAIVGASFDVNLHLKGQGWEINSVFDSKDLNVALLEGVIGYAFDKTGQLIEVNLGTYLKSNLEEDLFIPIIYTQTNILKQIPNLIRDE